VHFSALNELLDFVEREMEEPASAEAPARADEAKENGP
jgi:hypothetical protein